MADFHFSDQQLDNELVISIASLLDAANVPNILWGNYLLAIYGVPTIVDGVSFIVPDEHIDVSFSAISKAGFHPCSQPLECPHSNSRFCPPFEHLHINDELAVSLFRKSDLLCEPGFEISFQFPNSNIMSASDPRLPSPIPGHGGGRILRPSPVRILNPLRYCETLILLVCRDYDTFSEAYWVVLLTYLLEYVNGTAIFNEAGLREGFKEFYQALGLAQPNMYSIMEDLRRDLIQKGLQVKQN